MHHGHAPVHPDRSSTEMSEHDAQVFRRARGPRRDSGLIARQWLETATVADGRAQHALATPTDEVVCQHTDSRAHRPSRRLRPQPAPRAASRPRARRRGSSRADEVSPRADRPISVGMAAGAASKPGERAAEYPAAHVLQEERCEVDESAERE